MPNLIKGANVVWKDSVTIQSSIPQNQVIHSNQEQQRKQAEEEKKRIALLEQNLKNKLEEEYRKKTEGLEARYKLLGEQQRKENAQIALDAKAAADTMLSEAQAKAEQIIGSAQSDYEEKMREAHEEGYNAGAEVAKAEFVKMMTRLKNAVDGVTELQKYVMETSKGEIASLTVEIVRKILAMDIDKEDAVLQNMITEQLKGFRNYKKVRIYLSGYDIHTEALADVLVQNKLLESSDCLTVQNINEAPEGTCIIETETQMEDISIAEQLENLIKNVRNIAVEEESQDYGDEGYDYQGEF